MTIKQNGGIFGRNPTFNDVTIEGEIESSGDIIVGSAGRIGVGDTNPVNGYVTVRGESTVGTKNGHIMLTGDSATAGQGPQVVFSESGSGSNWVGAAIGFTRTGGSGIGDLSFSTRQTAGNADTTAVEAMKINSAGNVYVSTGNLVISTSGKGIDFSATSGTGTSELLDDYEEGTWTPTLVFGAASTGITYSVQNGLYTKVGRAVTVRFEITLSSKGSSTGEAYISGLPYTTASLNAMSVYLYSNFDATYKAGIAYLSVNSIYEIAANGTAPFFDTQFTNTSRFFGTCTYQI
jgi:hypothetical protein